MKKLIGVALLFITPFSVYSNTTETTSKPLVVHTNGLVSSAIISKLSIHEGYDPRYKELKRKYEESQKRIGSLTSLYNEAKHNAENLSSMTNELKDKLSKALLLGDIEQNYYYVTAEHRINEEQAAPLAEIFSAIKDIPKIGIQIIGRADPRGNAEYNRDLSEKRANYIAELAINKGVPTESISAEGMGIVGEEKLNSELYFFDRFSTVRIFIKD